MEFRKLKFKKVISTEEKIRCITLAVEGMFADDEYLPEIYEEQFWLNIVRSFASDNIDELETTIDELMTELYTGELMGNMIAVISTSQLGAIRTAIDKRIEMRLARKPMDEFFEKAAGLLTMIENAVDGVDLKAAIDAFGNLDVGKEIGMALAETRGKDVKVD
jgi:hypothetical protein